MGRKKWCRVEEVCKKDGLFVGVGDGLLFTGEYCKQIFNRYRANRWGGKLER